MIFEFGNVPTVWNFLFFNLLTWWFMVFNATFNNISFTSWRFIDVFIWLFQCSIITL